VGDVETLLVKYEQVFHPRLFVVKAYQLKRLIMRCQLCTTARHAAADAVEREEEAGLLEEEQRDCDAGAASKSSAESITMAMGGTGIADTHEHDAAVAAAAGLPRVQLV
jgi:hypothetical protein